MKVQVRQRAALAADVDEVVGAAQQAKAALVQQLQHVGQRRGLFHVATLHDEGIFASGVGLAVDAQFTQRRPYLAGRGAPRRHLAGFGAAIDLDHQTTQRLLGLRRQLRRQRRGGRQHQVDRRQRHARQQQRLQMEGRRHQRAWPGHTSQRLHDVGRVKRPAGIEAGTPQHGQQHGGLQAITVLRGHRGDGGHAGQAAAAHQLRQSLGLRRDVGHQRPPALGMRLRCTSGARGQQAHGRHVVSQCRQRLRCGARRSRCQLRQLGQFSDRDRHQRQQRVQPRRHVVDQRVQRARACRCLLQRLRQRVGRHQRQLPAQQRRCQAERKVQPVLAQVDRAARRQAGRQLLRHGQELQAREGNAVAVGDGRRQVARRQQRRSRRAHRRRLTAGPARRSGRHRGRRQKRRAKTRARSQGAAHNGARVHPRKAPAQRWASARCRTATTKATAPSRR